MAALVVIVIGLLGMLGMLYLGVIGAASDLIFGDPRLEIWSGEWWWIPFVAVGGLVITALRGWFKTQERTSRGASP